MGGRGPAVAAGRVLAQQRLQDTEALRHARLVVWVVPHPCRRQLHLRRRGYGGSARRPPGYGEQNASNFGTAASQYGSSASNVGLPSDSPQISREAAGGRTQQGTGRPVTPRRRSERRDPVEQTAERDFWGRRRADYGTAASNHGQAPSTLGQANASNGTESQATDRLWPECGQPDESTRARSASQPA